MNVSLVWSLPLAAFVSLACAREPSSNAPRETSAASRAPSKPKPADSAARTRQASLADTPPPALEPGFQHGQAQASGPARAPLKNVGKVGELLESDVFTFKLLAVAPCGAQPDPKTAKINARRVVAARVEITAKAEGVGVSPRDVSIGVGGIVFNGSVDPKRKLEGCEPLLETSVLLPKKSTTGFVLFDIPVTGPGSDLEQMGLIYQPTRFGGAGPVMVQALRR